MTPLAQALSLALVQFVWQGFIVSLFVSVLLFLLRERSPQLRYLVSCGALFALATLPVVTVVSVYDPLSHDGPGLAAITLTIRAVWNGAPSPVARWLGDFQPWVLRVWIMGVVFLSLRLAWLGTRVSLLGRSGSPPDESILAIAAGLARRMGTSRAIRVLVSTLPDGPSVAGWIRPVILLPAATILNLTTDQLEAILAHEIAHLRRYDDVVNIAQAAIETLLFYHPAVWWVSNRIRRERELCCDDLAVRTCGDALCYARALTALEKLRVDVPQLALGALGITDAPLEYRIRRIVGKAPPESIPSSFAGVLAVGLAMACAAVYSSPARGSAQSPHTLPEYPESARDQGIQGTVPVSVNVDALGRVREARAMGGPRELRQAAVESASAVHFSPETSAGMKRVNVAFELDPPSTPTPGASVTLSAPAPAVVPARPGPRWVDQGESILGLAAGNESDPVKKLELLKKWKQQYPESELASQRKIMTAQTLFTVLYAAYGKSAANSEILNAGKLAGMELLDDFEGYFDEAVKPENLAPEQWAEALKASQVQIHTVFAYIAQVEKDDATAEAELRRVLEVDPDQASASYQLGDMILLKMTHGNEGSFFPEAIYEFARALSVTGRSALSPDDRIIVDKALRKGYVTFHGSTEGLEDLKQRASAAALPPVDFHILSVAEVNEIERSAQRSLERETHPELRLWASIQTRLQAHGEDYFPRLRGQCLPRRSGIEYAGPAMFRATIVKQLSPTEILVSVDGVTTGDAILRFADNIKGAVDPGATLQFKGVVEAYANGVLTFTIPAPKKDIAGIKLSFDRSIHGNFLTRLRKMLFSAGPHAA